MFDRRQYNRDYMRAFRNSAKGRRYLKAYKARPEWKLQLKGYNLRYSHGLDLARLKRRLALQNNACAICKKRLTTMTAKVDHCHKTKSKRGLLCNHCNLGLGHFCDSTKLLRLAIKYLVNASLYG